MPVWTRRYGQMWQDELAALDRIHTGSVNADHQAYIHFKEKVDLRDSRPMNYPLRLVFNQERDASTCKWRRDAVCAAGKTAKIGQFRGIEMLVVGDISAVKVISE